MRALTQQNAAAGAATTPPAMAAPQTSALGPKAGAESTPEHTGEPIKLDVVVADKSGKPVAGLDINDFTLLDNKVPAKIVSFQAFDGTMQKPRPPVQVMIVIDAVNLPFGQVADERLQIVGFLKQNGGRLAEPTTVYAMTNAGVSTSGWPTLDGNALAAATDQLEIGLRTTTRSEGAWGAIERFGFSLEEFISIVNSQAKTPGRKLLIWAGPGWPMLDGPGVETSDKNQRELFDTIVQLSDKLRQARISVYGVALGMPGIGSFLYQQYLKGVKKASKAISPNLGLRVLAVQSGGRAIVPDNDLAGQIGRCVQDATAFYTLSFDPPHVDHANEYHDLKIEFDKPGLTALTNTGYYDQP